jgi:hypothetical protein
MLAWEPHTGLHLQGVLGPAMRAALRPSRVAHVHVFFALQDASLQEGGCMSLLWLFLPLHLLPLSHWLGHFPSLASLP